MTCWVITIEAQCEKCGRFTTAHRGPHSALATARAELKRQGWVFDAKTRTALCNDCK